MNHMNKFILIVGGARSGKSRYAEELAKGLGKKVAFIATACALDKEMRQRIKLHKLSRPRRWKVIEEGKDPGGILLKLKGKYEVVLIDCLALLISNLLQDNLTDKEIETKTKRLVRAILKNKFAAILVSNDVGGGIVPGNPLARRFRDVLGLANQMMAEKANEVIFMQSGIPLVIKKDDKKCKN